MYTQIHKENTEEQLFLKLFYFQIHLGTRFWVYNGESVLGPRNIEKLGLPSTVEKVEGAMQKGKDKVFLFSGENFWRWVWQI